MAKFLIDANLPYNFSFWNNSDCIHVSDIDESLSDEEIWKFAQEKSLTIVTKDADFSSKIIFHTPPPKVIHLKFGNMRIGELFDFFQKNWNEIKTISDTHKLTNVYNNRIEGIE